MHLLFINDFYNSIDPHFWIKLSQSSNYQT